LALIANYSYFRYTPSLQCLTPCQASYAISSLPKFNQIGQDWLGGACSAAASAMQDPSLPCAISASDRVILLSFINSVPQVR
jgi:hypothetical protein